MIFTDGGARGLNGKTEGFNSILEAYATLRSQQVASTIETRKKS